MCHPFCAVINTRAFFRCFVFIVLGMSILNLNNVSCPSVMHGKFWLLSPGKASSHSTALHNFFCFVCAGFSRFHTTGCEAYSFTTDGFGIFNVRSNWVRAVHTKGGSGTNKSAEDLTRRDRNVVSHPAPPGDRTQGLRGFEFRL